MAPPEPELSPGHTKDGGERPPRLREAFILLPVLRRHRDPRPAPAAPSRRAASRCGDRAGRSAAPGAGGRFVGGGRHWRGQSPSQDPTRPRHAAPRRPLAPLRSAPLPPPLPLPLPLPPCPGDAIGAAPPPSPPRKRPTAADPTEIGPGVTKLMEKKTKGLEAPSFPLVAVGVPDASGRTNPVAFMSNVLCCVPAGGWCFCSVWHRTGEYRPEYERLRKTLNPHVNLYLREKAQNKQKREQLEHLWKDMGSVCVQGSTLAGPDASAMGPSELILTRGTLNEEQEERESDADGIDHEGKGMRSKSCLSRNPLYMS
ncbi:uncharacterized protein LOC127460915 [Manacus candei]|uniref:uncharacterized protein LOC127460915 n=1 Tax=Manacus candei TaxID=415023 RepID=UPI002227FD99|nr:uncharacterized protein LOC127460915 [Manacus candei]